MIVYLATNRQNGRVYVGATQFHLEVRKQMHVWTCRNKPRPFAKAIQTFGLEGFHWTILGEFTDREAMYAAERDWIVRLDARNPERGYNVSKGRGWGGVPMSERARQARSRNGKANKGRVHGPYSEARWATMLAARSEMVADERLCKLKRADLPAILELRAQGLSCARIAARYGVSDAGIRKYLKRHTSPATAQPGPG